MEFNFKRVTLGNILSTLTMIGSIWIFTARLESEIAVIKNDITWIKQALSNNGWPLTNRNVIQDNENPRVIVLDPNKTDPKIGYP